MINLKIKILAIVISSHCICHSQITYDTIYSGKGNHQKLNLNLGNGSLQFYEIIETDIDIRDGKIEIKKEYLDTIGIKHNETQNRFEVILSKKTWAKNILGKNCLNVSYQITALPSLLLQRNAKTGELSLINQDSISKFMLSNYKIRLQCIDTLEDQYMKKHILEDIRIIENDSINLFIPSLSSHFAHLYALIDLAVPKETSDTIICNVTSNNSNIPIEYRFKTTKNIKKDSSVVINYTDKVNDYESINKQFVKNMYEPFEKHYSEEEKHINKIRIESIKDEDKAQIVIGKNGELKRFLRVIQSYILDVDLNPNYSFYNYEIKPITTSNMR